MENKDNKKNKTKASKLWDTLSPWLFVGGLVFGIICIIAGVEALTEHAPFVECLIGTLKALFQAYILLPLSIIALIVVVELFKALFEEHPFLCIVLIILIVIAVPKGASVVKKSYLSSGDHFTQKQVQTQWNYFEKISRIGDEYQDISKEYGPLSDEFLMNGGIFLKGSNELYYSFPEYSKSSITASELCNGMAGKAEDLFGYKDSITVDGLIDDLGLTSETEFEGNLTFKKTSSSGYYYVTIMSVDITNNSDSITPETWISVIQRNRTIISVGSLASDQDATRETVFFVEDGNRYHRDSSCSTLHDSDVIYECYLDEVPDGRSECGVCN